MYLTFPVEAPTNGSMQVCITPAKLNPMRFLNFARRLPSEMEESKLKTLSANFAFIENGNFIHRSELKTCLNLSEKVTGGICSVEQIFLSYGDNYSFDKKTNK